MLEVVEKRIAAFHVAVACALIGMAFGRLVSFAIDRRIGSVPLLVFAVELLLAAALFGAVWPAN